MVLQASFNLNDPDIYVTPKMIMWLAGTSVAYNSHATQDFIVPEGHFWEVERLTASSDSATEQQAKLLLYNDAYYDSDYDTYSSNKAFAYYIGWADTPAATDAANNPYPGSCVVFADKNLPLFLYSGSRIELSAAEGYGEVEGYMAYFDYHF